MNQDTIPPFKYEPVKYVAAISGDDTTFRYEQVPVFLEHQTAQPLPAKADTQIKPEEPKSAFTYIMPHEPIVFSNEPLMAEQLAQLLVTPPVKPKPYPMNSEFQGVSLGLAILILGVVAIKLFLLYEKFCARPNS